MNYSKLFLDALSYLAATYEKFPKFMIEIIAENYGIPSIKVKELIREFKRSGVLNLLLCN